MKDILNSYKQAMLDELIKDILPFWMNNTVDNEHGGFYGEVSNDLVVNKEAHKAGVINSRVLWTFSTAYRFFGDEAYLQMADHAYDFLINSFWDKEYSGIYWLVDYKGNAVDDKKQIYNIAFAVYGLTEYYRASGKKESLDKAIELYNCIERYSYDSTNKGYFEALARDWKDLADTRLSAKEINCKKSMNTHLHILEAYTNLFRVWKDDEFRNKFKELIEVTADYIVDNEEYRFKLFFDEKWNSLDNGISYGHDIEGSWLLFEAAEVLGDEALINRVKDISLGMAKKVIENGIDEKNGGLLNEKHSDGRLDNYKAWWPQAEAMVGFLNAYELNNNEEYLKASFDIWNFTDKYFVDKTNGEWFNEVSLEGKTDEKMKKVDAWKCPYHNGRACFEIATRIDKLIK
jgi:cellobiose epimerase